jgi:hypothetical protein
MYDDELFFTYNMQIRGIRRRPVSNSILAKTTPLEKATQGDYRIAPK